MAGEHPIRGDALYPLYFGANHIADPAFVGEMRPDMDEQEQQAFRDVVTAIDEVHTDPSLQTRGPGALVAVVDERIHTELKGVRSTFRRRRATAYLTHSALIADQLFSEVV